MHLQNIPRLKPKGALSSLIFVMVLACVSRSQPGVRFLESVESVATLTQSVSLSDPHNYSFAVVGDIHIKHADGRRIKQMLGAAADEGDSFFVCLGDITDTGEESDYQVFRDAIAQSSFEGRVLPVIGNHDVFGEGWKHYLKWNGPSHYSTQIGNAKFIVLDTADGTVHPDEFEWFKDELGRSRPEHLFVLSHYAPVVPGIRTYLRIADDLEAARLMKSASEHQVTGWLAAHYHSYALGRIEGVDYLVAGGAGNRRFPPIQDYFFVQVKVSGKAVSYHLRILPDDPDSRPRY